VHIFAIEIKNVISKIYPVEGFIKNYKPSQKPLYSLDKDFFKKVALTKTNLYIILFIL